MFSVTVSNCFFSLAVFVKPTDDSDDVIALFGAPLVIVNIVDCRVAIDDLVVIECVANNVAEVVGAITTVFDFDNIECCWCSKFFSNDDFDIISPAIISVSDVFRVGSNTRAIGVLHTLGWDVINHGGLGRFVVVDV